MQLPSAYERVTSPLPFAALPEKKRILAEYLEDRSIHFGWELYRHSGEQGPSKHADFILVDREQVANLRTLVVLIKFTKSTRAKPTTDEVLHELGVLQTFRTDARMGLDGRILWVTIPFDNRQLNQHGAILRNAKQALSAIMRGRARPPANSVEQCVAEALTVRDPACRSRMTRLNVGLIGNSQEHSEWLDALNVQQALAISNLEIVDVPQTVPSVRAGAAPPPPPPLPSPPASHCGGGGPGGGDGGDDDDDGYTTDGGEEAPPQQQQPEPQQPEPQQQQQRVSPLKRVVKERHLRAFGFLEAGGTLTYKGSSATLLPDSGVQELGAGGTVYDTARAWKRAVDGRNAGDTRYAREGICTALMQYKPPGEDEHERGMVVLRKECVELIDGSAALDGGSGGNMMGSSRHQEGC